MGIGSGMPPVSGMVQNWGYGTGAVARPEAKDDDGAPPPVRDIDL